MPHGFELKGGFRKSAGSRDQCFGGGSGLRGRFDLGIIFCRSFEQFLQSNFFCFRSTLLSSYLRKNLYRSLYANQPKEKQPDEIFWQHSFPHKGRQVQKTSFSGANPSRIQKIPSYPVFSKSNAFYWASGNYSTQDSYLRYIFPVGTSY